MEREGILICDTAWDKPPSEIWFKGHSDWGAYFPRVFCHPVRKSGAEFKEDELNTSLDAYCSKCGEYLEEIKWLKSGHFCSVCGAQVERDAS